MVEPFLVREESSNALPLGIARSFVANATHDGLMFSVESGSEIVAVAVKSPKRHLVVTRAPEIAMKALARYIHEYMLPCPGVIGPNDAATALATEWELLTGQSPRVRMRLRLYEARTVLPAGKVAGSFRMATAADQDWCEWATHRFIDEATEETHENVRHRVQERILSGAVGLWTDGAIVSLAVINRRTESGSHLSSVYTPPDFRRHGYASACVAELTRRELATGRAFVTLYTDLANPTSNSIYTRIGYRVLSDSIDLAFAG